jgi:hypothetical protein
MNMKQVIRLTESQLTNLIKRVIRENTINEISPETFLSAALKSKEGGRFGQAQNMTELFFDRFIGKPFMGGTITNIAMDPHGVRGDGFYILTDPQKDFPVAYSITDDKYENLRKKITRQDANLLIKLAKHVNPDTQYRFAQDFDLIDNYKNPFGKGWNIG